MKAWQVITHPPTSPTWKRLKEKPPGRLENYGRLMPTPENLEAWRRSVSFAKTLSAEVIVLQTPPSFGFSQQNLEHVRRFFAEATKIRDEVYPRLMIGWEPRGTWHSHIGDPAVREVFCRNQILHIVDPLRRDPLICEGQRLLYFRLHGLGGREVNYRYRYTDDDLTRLASKIRNYLDANTIDKVYVMFNNVYMASDAKRFRALAQKAGLNAC